MFRAARKPLFTCILVNYPIWYHFILFDTENGIKKKVHCGSSRFGHPSSRTEKLCNMSAYYFFTTKKTKLQTPSITLKQKTAFSATLNIFVHWMPLRRGHFCPLRNAKLTREQHRIGLKYFKLHDNWSPIMAKYAKRRKIDT